MKDIRDKIFNKIAEQRVTAAIIADEEGILSGIAAAEEEADRIGLKILDKLKEGHHIIKGNIIIRFEGTPKQIAMAEEVMIGHLAKTSGVATSANLFIEKAGALKPHIGEDIISSSIFLLSDTSLRNSSSLSLNICLCEIP